MSELMSVPEGVTLPEVVDALPKTMILGGEKLLTIRRLEESTIKLPGCISWVLTPKMVRDGLVTLFKALALSKTAMAGVAGSERYNRSPAESRKIPPIPEENPPLGVIVRTGAMFPLIVDAEP